MQTIPEVGSKWLIGNRVMEVTRVNKRGRGYQVESIGANEDFRRDESPWTIRLANFTKAAKPL